MSQKLNVEAVREKHETEGLDNEDIYALLDTLEAAEKRAENEMEARIWNVQERERISVLLNECCDAMESDRDHWKARAEALERAIHQLCKETESDCFYCARGDEECEVHSQCGILADYWIFNQSKFTPQS